VKASPIQATAAAASVAALALAMGLGLYQAAVSEGGLPNLSLDYMPQIRTLDQDGDLEGAIRALRTATRVDASNPGVARVLEDAATRAGDLDSRIFALRAQLRVNPFDAEARQRLSQAFLVLAQQQPAARAQRTRTRAVWQAEKAVESAPASAAAHLTLARALQAAGLEERAHAQRAEAQKLDASAAAGLPEAGTP